MNAIIDGLHINYLREGSGPVVLMLHGWGSDHSTFALIAKKLAEDYEVVRLDLPGFGKSEQPKTDWSIPEYAHFVNEFLKKLEVEEVMTMVGHSMGGRILIHGLGTKKLQAEKLVLIASAGIKESVNLRNRLFMIIAKAGKIAVSILPERYQSRLKSQLYERAGAEDYMAAGSMKEIFKKVINTDATKDAPHIKSKTLLIYGDDDASTPVSYGRIFDELIPVSHLEIVAGAGHFVHTEKPVEVLEVLEQFLQS